MTFARRVLRAPAALFQVSVQHTGSITFPSTLLRPTHPVLGLKPSPLVLGKAGKFAVPNVSGKSRQDAPATRPKTKVKSPPPAAVATADTELPVVDCPCKSLFPPAEAAQETKERILFIGGGNMGSAMLSALRGRYPAESFLVAETQENIRKVHKKSGINVTESAVDACEKFQPTYIYVCVKPHFLDELSETIRPHIPSGAIVISCVLGSDLTELQHMFGTPRVVRIMPNTNADIRRGVVVWTANKDANHERDMLSKEELQELTKQLQCMGHELMLPSEKYIDAATAVAGSGPAYYLLLLEAATDAAVHLGLPRQLGEELVFATILGTVLRAEGSEMPLTVLKQQVATPGGATMAALYKLEQRGLRTVISDAMWACYRRTLQVGGTPTSDVGPDRPAHVATDTTTH